MRVAGIRTLTTADLQANGGSYVLRQPPVALQVRAAPAGAAAEQGDVLPVLVVTRAQIDAGQYVVRQGAPVLLVAEAPAGAPVRGGTAMPVVYV